MKREFIKFGTRQDRPRFFSERFKDPLQGSVLDVGCDEAVLRDFVGADRYAGIDPYSPLSALFLPTPSSKLPLWNVYPLGPRATKTRTPRRMVNMN